MATLERPLNYSQVRNLHKSLQERNPEVYGNMDIEQFVDFANQQSGSDYFSSGRNPNLIGEVFRQRDAVLEGAGYPQMFEDLGQGVGGIVDSLVGNTEGRYSDRVGQTFRETPAMLTNMIPMFRGGAVAGNLLTKGSALSGLIQGADTATRSGDIGQGVRSGALTALIPGVASLGRNATTNVLARLFPSVAGGGRATAVANYVGEQLGVGGMFAADQAVSNVQAGTNWYGETPTDFVVDQVAGALPFLPLDVAQVASGVPSYVPGRRVEQTRADRLRSTANFLEQAFIKRDAEIREQENNAETVAEVKTAEQVKEENKVLPNSVVENVNPWTTATKIVDGKIEVVEEVGKAQDDIVFDEFMGEIDFPMNRADLNFNPEVELPTVNVEDFGELTSPVVSDSSVRSLQTVSELNMPSTMMGVNRVQANVINAGVEKIANMPSVKEDGIQKQSQEVRAVADATGTKITSPRTKVKIIEVSFSNGDHLNDAIDKQLEIDKSDTEMEVRLERQQLPENVSTEAVEVIDAQWNALSKGLDRMQFNTLEERGKFLNELQRQHVSFSKFALKHQHDPETLKWGVGKYVEWTRGDKRIPLGDWLSKEFYRKGELSKKRETTKTKKSKEFENLQNRAAVVWDEIGSLVEKGDKDAEGIFDKFSSSLERLSAEGDVTTVTQKLVEWWEDTAPNKRTSKGFNSYFEKVIQNVGFARTEQGDWEGYRNDDAFGPAKGVGLKTFNSRLEAERFIDRMDLVMKDENNFEYAPRKGSKDKWTIARRARTRFVSFADNDGQIGLSLVDESYQNEVFRDTIAIPGQMDFMYIGERSLRRMQASTEIGDKLIVAKQQARQANLREGSKLSSKAEYDINERIRKETGWFLDPYSGKWLYEISDFKSLVSDKGLMAISGKGSRSNLKLGSVLDHVELFKFFPSLKNVKVAIDENVVVGDGWWDPNTNTIGVGARYADMDTPAAMVAVENAVTEVLLHEIQHVIQERSGLPVGSAEDVEASELPLRQAALAALRVKQNKGAVRAAIEGVVGPGKLNEVETIARFVESIPAGQVSKFIKRIEQLSQRDAFTNYWNNVGEMLARDVAGRWSYSDRARQQIPPYSDGGIGRDGQVIPPSRAIVRFDSLSPALSVNKITPEVFSRMFTKLGFNKLSANYLGNAANKVNKLFNYQDNISWTNLKTSNDLNEVAGLAMTASDGSRLIALRKVNEGFSQKAMMFTALHELGHHIVNGADKGKVLHNLAPTIAKVKDMLPSMDLASREGLLRYVYDEMFPQQFKDSNIEKAVFSKENLTKDSEVLANMWSMLSHGFGEYGHVSLKDKISNLPLVISKAAGQFTRMMRDVWRAFRGFNAFETALGKGVNRQQLDNVLELSQKLKTVSREMAKIDRAVDNFTKLGEVYHGGLNRNIDRVDSDPMFLRQLDKGSKQMMEFMTFKGDRWKNTKNGVQKILPPLHMADSDPRLKSLAAIPLHESITEKHMTRKYLSIKYADNPNQTSGIVKINTTNSPVAQLNRDPVASQMWNDLMRYVNVKGDASVKAGKPKGDTLFDLIAQNDPYVMGELGKLTDEQKSNLLEKTARIQMVNERFANDRQFADTQAFTNLLGSELIARKLVPAEVATAKQVSATLVSLAQDPNMLFSEVIKLTQDPNIAKAMTDFIVAGHEMIQRNYQMYLSRPYHITEQRFGRYHIAYLDSKTNKTGLVSFDSTNEANAWLEANKSNTNIKLKDKSPRDSYQGKPHLENEAQIFEVLSNEEQKTKLRMENSLAQLGVPKAEIDQLLSTLSFSAGLSERQSIEMFGDTTHVGRRFAAGRELLDMEAQQERYVAIQARAMARRISDTDILLHRKDPTVYNETTVGTTQQIEDAIAAYRIPDTSAQQALSTLGFTYFVGLNWGNAIIEQTSQLLQLAPKLTEEGAGIIGSNKLVLDANKTMLNWGLSGKLDPELEHLLARAELDGRRGLGFFSALDNIQDTDITATSSTTATTLDNVIKLSTAVYSYGVKYNESVALISAFNLKKSQLFPGKTTLTDSEFTEVYNDAIRIAGIANSSLGKVNRPTALFNTNNTLWRTTASAVSGLTSYTAGMYANLLRQFRRGFGSSLKPYLSPEQRTNSKKAFVQSIATLTSLAGIPAGIPLASIFATIMEGFVDEDIDVLVQSAIYDMTKEMAGDDAANFAKETAAHGLLHAMGLPIDVSAKVSPGGLYGFNSYNGFEAKRLMGPVAGIATNLYTTLGEAAKGDWTRAMESGLPPVFSNIFSLIANSGSITDYQGNPISGLENPSTYQQIGSALGLKPRQQVIHEDQARFQKRADEIGRSKNSQLVAELADIVKTGNYDAATSLIAAHKAQEPLVDPQALVNSVINKLEVEQFGYSPADEVTRMGSTVWDTMSGRPASDPSLRVSNTERLAFRDGIKRTWTGEGVSQQQVQKSILIDQIIQSRPNISKARASFIIDQIFAQNELANADISVAISSMR